MRSTLARGDFSADSSEPNAKIAIPRLPRQERRPSEPTVRQKERVPRACRACHRRKIKCSGTIPRCGYCEKSNRRCIYDSTRRDKLAIATSQNKRLHEFLRELSSRVNEEDRALIEDTLQDSDDDEGSPGPNQSEGSLRSQNDLSVTKSESRPQTPQSFNITSELTDTTTLTMPSLESWPYVPYAGSYNFSKELPPALRGPESGIHVFNSANAPDNLRGTTIFMGQMCEAHWMLDLRRRIVAQLTIAPDMIMSLSDFNFYLDCPKVQLHDPGNSFQLPDEMSARVLFDCYLNTVQRAFPLLSTGLYSELLRYYQSIQAHQIIDLPQSWYALVNLVLAIGSRLSRLINTDQHQSHYDEAVYVARTYQLLGLNETGIVLSEPDLAFTQATGLLAFYYMSTGQINRAWIMISAAVRFALSLGLHNADHQSTVDTSQRQVMSQTWWSLHNLESLLSSISGRPCMLRNEDITTPFPSDFVTKRAEQASDDTPSMSFQDAQVRLAIFSQRILSKLYTDRRTAPSWTETHRTMTSLLSELDGWAAEAMPQHLQGSDTSPSLDRLQLLLRKHYYRLKIYITRPSLMRIEGMAISDQDKITAFDRAAAEICIQTAQDVVALLPDQIDLRVLYERGPWWTIVHNFMQTSAILLIAISLRTGFNTLVDSSITSFRKLVLWLQAMRIANDVAESGYRVLYNLVKSVPLTTWPEILDCFPDEIGSQHGEDVSILESMDQINWPWQG